MSIRFSYLYRDYANYKNFNEVIFGDPDCLPLQEIKRFVRNHLIDELWFYSSEWKVPDLHFGDWDADDDHFLHEFESIEETDELPTTDITIDDFLKIIGKARNRFII